MAPPASSGRRAAGSPRVVGEAIGSTSARETESPRQRPASRLSGGRRSPSVGSPRVLDGASGCSEAPAAARCSPRVALLAASATVGGPAAQARRRSNSSNNHTPRGGAASSRGESPRIIDAAAQLDVLEGMLRAALRGHASCNEGACAVLVRACRREEADARAAAVAAAAAGGGADAAATPPGTLSTAHFRRVVRHLGASVTREHAAALFARHGAAAAGAGGEHGALAYEAFATHLMGVPLPPSLQRRRDGALPPPSPPPALAEPPPPPSIGGGRHHPPANLLRSAVALLPGHHHHHQQQHAAHSAESAPVPPQQPQPAPSAVPDGGGDDATASPAPPTAPPPPPPTAPPPPPPPVRYRVTTVTSNLPDAGTAAPVYVTLAGPGGRRLGLGEVALRGGGGADGAGALQRDHVDEFVVAVPAAQDCGAPISRIIIERGGGLSRDADWHLARVRVDDLQRGHSYTWRCGSWLSARAGVSKAWDAGLAAAGASQALALVEAAPPGVVDAALLEPDWPDDDDDVDIDANANTSCAGDGINAAKALMFDLGASGNRRRLSTSGGGACGDTYRLSFETSDRWRAGTAAPVRVQLEDANGGAWAPDLTQARGHFERGGRDEFYVATPMPLGRLVCARVWRGGSGGGGGGGVSASAWHLEQLTVTHLPSGRCWRFACDEWVPAAAGPAGALALDGEAADAPAVRVVVGGGSDDDSDDDGGGGALPSTPQQRQQRRLRRRGPAGRAARQLGVGDWRRASSASGGGWGGAESPPPPPASAASLGCFSCLIRRAPAMALSGGQRGGGAKEQHESCAEHVRSGPSGSGWQIGVALPQEPTRAGR